MGADKMSMVDMTGKPRSREDVEAALKFVEREMAYNPMARAADGTPALIHYMTIRDALRAYLLAIGSDPQSAALRRRPDQEPR